MRVSRPGLFDDADDSMPASKAMNAAIIGALDEAMPIMIRELRQLNHDRRIAKARAAWGRVTGWSFSTRRISPKRALSGGADLMFGGRHQEAEFNALVVVLAALAYQPGGVTFATRHWCTDHQACEHAATRAARRG